MSTTILTTHPDRTAQTGRTYVTLSMRRTSASVIFEVTDGTGKVIARKASASVQYPLYVVSARINGYDDLIVSLDMRTANPTTARKAATKIGLRAVVLTDDRPSATVSV